MRERQRVGEEKRKGMSVRGGGGGVKRGEKGKRIVPPIWRRNYIKKIAIRDCSTFNTAVACTQIHR
jgi:hypothetical protein